MTYKEKAEAYLTKWYYKQNPKDDCFVPHLEHWFRLLVNIFGEPTQVLADTNIVDFVFGGERITFNLTTGNPNTPADYQAFCEIVGISSK